MAGSDDPRDFLYGRTWMRRCETCGFIRKRLEFFPEQDGTCNRCKKAEAERERKAAEKRRKRAALARASRKKTEAEKEAGARERIRRERHLARLRKETKERDQRIRAEERMQKLMQAEERQLNAAQREMVARELSRRRLLHFIKRMFPGYQAGWVHKDICARLERFSDAVAAGKSPRLMLQMPPRAGKSEILSKHFPAWHLGRYPQHEIIACSYSGDLANKFSRQAREIMRHEDFRTVFDASRLNTDAQNVQGWYTTKGGGYVPAGVGGPITGKGANILIIDDPLKNSEEADSEVTREAQKEWYQSTAYTRLEPGGGVLIVQTRWHYDDLSGWLEDLMLKSEGDQWEIVRYPAIAEEDETFRAKGEALHPERYDEAAYARIKRAVGPRVWSALYQQRPTPEEGAYFTMDMFRYYDADVPPRLRIYQAWDLAIGKKETNDWTVGVTVGLDQEGYLWVLDIQRGRWDSYEIVEHILDGYERWWPDAVGIEKGQIQMAIGPYLEQRIRERRLFGFFYDELPPGRRDKPARARSIQGRMSQGMVLFPRHEFWLRELQNEMLQFPNGKHDDQVDALAWIGLMMDGMVAVGGRAKQKRTSWRDRFLRGTRKKTAMSA